MTNTNLPKIYEEKNQSLAGEIQDAVFWANIY